MLALPVSLARADRAALIQRRPDRAAIDWTRGMIEAVGAAAAQLGSPSPAIARVGAERDARAAARRRLRALAGELPWAGGGTVGDRAAADPAVQARLAAAVDRALDLAVDYGSDGSTVVRAGLPVEAVRQAVVGPAGPATAAGPSELVVEAPGLAAPVCGLGLAAGDQRYAGPTIYVRATDRPVRARGGEVAAGFLPLDLAPAELAAARAAGALVIVIVKGDKR